MLHEVHEKFVGTTLSATLGKRACSLAKILVVLTNCDLKEISSPW